MCVGVQSMPKLSQPLVRCVSLEFILPKGMGWGSDHTECSFRYRLGFSVTRTIKFLIGLILLAASFLLWQASQEATVLVEWSTASELDTVGFNLYRADTPQGPFVQVNNALIPASSEPLTGGEYSYRDSGVQPGKTYYYELEEVQSNGGRDRFGPISVQADSGSAAMLMLILGVVLILLLGVGVFFTRRLESRRLESRRSESRRTQGGSSFPGEAR